MHAVRRDVNCVQHFTSGATQSHYKVKYSILLMWCSEGALFVQSPSYQGRVFSIQIFNGHTFDMINVIQLLKDLLSGRLFERYFLFIIK